METKNAERVWGLVQRDTGSIAICNWYFPPGASLDGIESMKQELTDMNEVADSVIAVGDLNIHHASWLRFSNGETTRGRQLKDICDSFGLRQLISQPTRGEYLLDLCLSNSQSTQTEVKAKIADHACLLVKEPDAVEIRQFEPRHIWKLEEANWPEIDKYMSDFDWNCLGEGTVDQALDIIMSVLDSQMQAHIPRFTKFLPSSCCQASC